MIINNGDGTYTMGPADVICIFRLPSGWYHMAVLEENPMPGPIKPIGECDFIRLKSKMHHTEGAETLEGAQQHLLELRKQIKIGDANVVSDAALDISDPVTVFPVRNWTKEKIPLKEALGFPVAV